MYRYLAAALLLASPLAAQKPFWPDEGVRTWTPRPTVPAITANDLRSRLYPFSDDSMMGREAGTLGNYKGAEYIASEFKRLGLKPAGEDGTYFQTIGYGDIGFDSAASRLLVAGQPLAAVAEWVPLAPSTQIEVVGKAQLAGLPTVYGGRFGDSTTAFTPAMVSGKVVVFSPAAMVEVETRFGKRQTMAPGDFTAAQRSGAAAILLVGAPSATAFRHRNSMMPTVAGNTAGAMITAAVAERIMGGPLSELAVGTPGKSVSGDWDYKLTLPRYPARNVIAVLPGSDPVLKHQYVVIGAHNDHVGMARSKPYVEHDSLRAYNTVLKPQGANDRVNPADITAAQWDSINTLIAAARKVRPPRPDSVYNGADDDGSGTVVLLEIAERLANGEKPKRSVLFNSHVAEEKGLLGSSWFVDHPTIPLDSVVAALNMDMLGKGRVTDVKFGGPNSVQLLGSRRLSAEYGDLIDSLNAVRSEPMAIDYSWDRTNALNRFCRSDQVNYIRKGIPTTYFSLGYARDYHQLTDEPQYIDYEHGARLGRFIHDILLTVANRPHRLAILPDSLQDKSAKCGR